MANKIDLSARSAVVTGGAQGIGRAIVERFLESGAAVAIWDRDINLAKKTAAELQKRGRVAPVAVDVTNYSDVERARDETIKAFGRIDILVNNAGIAGPTGGVDEIAPADWRRTVDICLTGQFLCAHHAVPMLKASGGGSIVNMSSAAGRFGYAFRTPYSAAKWGIIGFTQSLAKELGPDNIRVNAILPGIVKGPRMDRVIEARAKQVGVSHAEMEKRYLERVSLRRMVTPEDIAESVMFLLSRAGANISGQSLGVDANVEGL
jgi:NAD(P)-dependent dehydrogenase (short-subunit alcohol dehydrogenase family)